MSFFNRLMYSDDRSPAPEEKTKDLRDLAQHRAESAPPNDDDLPVSDRDIAAQLPPENTYVSADGYMDSHRKPIVSINGKDVADHGERREPAA